MHKPEPDGVYKAARQAVLVVHLNFGRPAEEAHYGAVVEGAGKRAVYPTKEVEYGAVQPEAVQLSQDAVGKHGSHLALQKLAASLFDDFYVRNIEEELAVAEVHAGALAVAVEDAADCHAAAADHAGAFNRQPDGVVAGAGYLNDVAVGVGDGALGIAERPVNKSAECDLVLAVPGLDTGLELVCNEGGGLLTEQGYAHVLGVGRGAFGPE